MVRRGYGRKDGSQRGRKSGGRGRNRTTVCRHPSKKKFVFTKKRRRALEQARYKWQNMTSRARKKRYPNRRKK